MYPNEIAPKQQIGQYKENDYEYVVTEWNFHN